MRRIFISCLMLIMVIVPSSVVLAYDSSNPGPFPQCLQQSYYDANLAYCQNLGYNSPGGSTGTGGTVQPPYSPYNLTISGGVLTWSENGTYDYFNIYVNGSIVGTATETTYTFSSPLNTGDVVKVTAVNAGGESVDYNNSLTYTGSDTGSGGTGGDTGSGTPAPAPTGFTVTQNTDGSFTLTWDADPNLGSSGYDIWTDGINTNRTDIPPFTLGTLGDGTHTLCVSYYNSGVGSQKACQDVTVGSSSGGTTGGTTSCDGCTMLTQMLACPGWSQYMSDISNAIHSGLPTLPEWRSIADQFVDAFSNYMGTVPAVPSTADIANNITPQLPTVNTTAPQVAPAAPSDFDNGPISFDITSGPQIPVLDDSQPIQINEPNTYIHADTNGVMVYPGDSRNNSDGIKTPNSFVSPYPTPVPSASTQSTSTVPLPGVGSGTISPSAIPVPSSSGGSMPVPTTTNNNTPVPTN